METSSDQTLPLSPTPRKPFVAFLLSLLTPGLGQVYNGQPKKAIVFWALSPALLFVLGLTKTMNTFYGFLISVFIALIFEIFLIADVVRNALRQKEYIKRKYNTWFYYLLIIIANIAIYDLIDFRHVLGIQTFKVVSPSSNPTLETGDFLVADMKAYNHKELSYGDLVVFNSPEGQKWIFRVVGLPNDQLQLNNNIISLSGKPGKSEFVKKSVSDDMPVSEFIEDLPDGHQHRIYISTLPPYDSSKITIKKIEVPSDGYYLLGDNRDNAMDSRYIGSVKRKDILGKILYSYWGKTTKRVNIDFRGQ